MIMQSDSVSKQVEMAILMGNIKPRERLIEMELSSRFNTSRFLVRKAIQELARKGLVEMIPHKGARVKDPTDEQVADMFLVRLNLELLAAEQMLNKLTSQKLAEIKKVQEEYRVAATSSGIDEMIEKNEQFHQTLYAATENTLLHELLDRVRNVTFFLRYNAYLLPGRRESSIADHDAIIKALERKNLNRLKAVTEKSVTFPMKTYLTKKANM